MFSSHSIYLYQPRRLPGRLHGEAVSRLRGERCLVESNLPLWEAVAGRGASAGIYKHLQVSHPALGSGWGKASKALLSSGLAAQNK